MYHDLILPFIMPIGFGIGHVGRVGSVFVTMSVTIERYFAIVHPLKHFSGKRYLLVTPIVTTILYNIPKFFEFQRTQVRFYGFKLVRNFFKVDGTALVDFFYFFMRINVTKV